MSAAGSGRGPKRRSGQFGGMAGMAPSARVEPDKGAERAGRAGLQNHENPARNAKSGASENNGQAYGGTEPATAASVEDSRLLRVASLARGAAFIAKPATASVKAVSPVPEPFVASQPGMGKSKRGKGRARRSAGCSTLVDDDQVEDGLPPPAPLAQPQIHAGPKPASSRPATVRPAFAPPSHHHSRGSLPHSSPTVATGAAHLPGLPLGSPASSERDGLDAIHGTSSRVLGGLVVISGPEDEGDDVELPEAEFTRELRSILPVPGNGRPKQRHSKFPAGEEKDEDDLELPDQMVGSGAQLAEDLLGRAELADVEAADNSASSSDSDEDNGESSSDSSHSGSSGSSSSSRSPSTAPTSPSQSRSLNPSLPPSGSPTPKASSLNGEKRRALPVKRLALEAPAQRRLAMAPVPGPRRLTLESVPPPVVVANGPGRRPGVNGRIGGMLVAETTGRLRPRSFPPTHPADLPRPAAGPSNPNPTHGANVGKEKELPRLPPRKEDPHYYPSLSFGGTTYVPRISTDVVETVLKINEHLVRILKDYMDNGWIDSPEFLVYQHRLHTNLAFLATAADALLHPSQLPDPTAPISAPSDSNDHTLLRPPVYVSHPLQGSSGTPNTPLELPRTESSRPGMLQPFLLPHGAPVPPSINRPRAHEGPEDAEVPMGYLTDDVARLMVGEKLGWWNARTALRSLEASESEGETESLVEGSENADDGEEDIGADSEEKRDWEPPMPDPFAGLGGDSFGAMPPEPRAAAPTGLEERQNIDWPTNDDISALLASLQADAETDSVQDPAASAESGEDTMMRDFLRFGDDEDEQSHPGHGSNDQDKFAGDEHEDEEEDDGSYVGDADSESSSSDEGSDSDSEESDADDEAEELDGDGNLADSGHQMAGGANEERVGLQTVSLAPLGQGRTVARVESRGGKRTVVFGGSWGL